MPLQEHYGFFVSLTRNVRGTDTHFVGLAHFLARQILKLRKYRKLAWPISSFTYPMNISVMR